MAEPLEQEEGKRPDPPVVAVLVPVVITMTAGQAAEYASWYELESKTFESGGVSYGPGGVAEAITDLQERVVSEAVLAALTQPGPVDELWSLVTVTTLNEEIIPVGEPFPGSEEGYVTGLCAHRVARSEWAAGFRCCEHCHGVTVNG